MDNSSIAKIFYEIAEILEIQNVEFKPRAYRKAAQAIESLGVNVKELRDKGRLKGIPGVGESIAKKIEELITTGRLKYYDELKKSLPIDFSSLENIEGLGPKKIALLYSKLGIKNAKDLEKAAKAGKIKSLAGFGVKTEKDIIENLGRNKEKRFLISVAMPIAENIIRRLKGSELVKAQFVGSLVRGKETIGDIDILALTKDEKATVNRFASLHEVKKVLVKGENKCSVVLNNDMRADLRVWPKNQYGSALNYFIGSKYHGIALRQIAMKKGMKLSEYGLFRGERVLASEREEDIYRLLGMDYIEPELRENHGEIDAAINHVLPKLVKLSDIRGDCQMHSAYSDGIHSVEEMAKKAKSLGYEYIAITDHGGNLKIANAMAYKSILERNKEIERISRNVGIKIISGIESNIDLKGNIDLTDKEAKEIDFVMASIHSGFKQPEDVQTKRILKAISNPHVNCIAHPTGRLLFGRRGYELDWDKIFKACKGNNVAIEINSQPDRLDINDEIAREAVKSGVKLMINTDAHTASQLEFMRYGVLQARRGWCEKKNVLNCLSYDDFIKEINRVQ
jgi:DNA polymerase (family 10)